jgi:hypothetical protein
LNTVTGSRARTYRARAASALASVGALLLSLGLVLMAAPAATADNPANSNDAAYWQTLPGEQCVKSDAGTQSGGYTITSDPQTGYYWSKLILKKGSGPDENTVIENPVKGTTYYHSPAQNGYSHVIACQAPRPTTTAAAPAVSQSTQCDVEGSYTIPATTGVQYQLDGTNIGAGTYPGPRTGTITAVATANHVLTNPGFSFALDVAPAEDCPAPSSTAVAPEVVQSAACDVEGSYVIPATPGVQYQLDGANIGAGTYPGPKAGTITAVATGNHVLTNPGFSFALYVTAATDCVSPSPSESVSTPPASTPPASTPPTIAGTESAAPQPSQTPEGEVAGTESTNPKPSKSDTPQVLGTEAAVPTAVAAGLGDLPGGPGATASASSLGSMLGQLLAAVGGLLLVGAGGLMFRRQVGGREA